MRGQGSLSALKLPSFRRRSKKIPISDFLVFNQELAALLKAGLPLMQALDLKLERMSDPRLKPVLTDIRDRVRSGEDLSEAFEHYGDMFPRLYPATLKAGERSGELESVLRRFIRYLALVSEARRKVTGALVYPSVLIATSFAMILVMALYVVPRFTSFYRDLNATLPLITRITLGFASTVRQNWWLILLAIVVGTFLFTRWKNTESGRIAFDRMKLKIPLVGDLLHRFGLSELSRSLATLLYGGIPLVPASEIAVGGVGNAYLRTQLEPTIALVRQGQPFHVALEESGVFTDMAIDMVKVGEATGALDEMLNSVSDFLDQQVEHRVARLLSLVEPILLVIMGVIILILLISIYLPMFGLLGQVGS